MQPMVSVPPLRGRLGGGYSSLDGVICSFPLGRLGWVALWVVLWVYPGLSLDVFVVVTSSPPSAAGWVDRRELALVRATQTADDEPQGSQKHRVFFLVFV